MELLVLIPVLGFALAWQHHRNATASASILHVVSLLIIVLFLASLLNLLKPAVVALLATGTVLAALEGIRAWKSKTGIPVPIGVFALLGVVFWLFHADSQLYHFDEYSHWGVFLKEMLAVDALWGSDSNAIHPRYLPGPTLWQYFFAVFSANPEGAGFLAQFVLLMTPLMVLWEKIAWRSSLWLLGIFVLVTVTMANFGHGFISLYVDHVLGAWFVGVILNFWITPAKGENRETFVFILPIAAIVLFKSVGIFFALGCIGIVSLLLIVRDDTALRAQDLPGRIRQTLVFSVLSCVLCYAVLTAWAVNRDAAAIVDDNTSTSGVVALLLAPADIAATERQSELTRRFVDVVLHQQVSKDALSAEYHAYSYAIKPLFADRFRLTTASTLGLALIAYLLLGRSLVAPHRQKSWFVLTFSTWLISVAYLFALYLGYRAVATVDNGILLSSFIRYIHSMILPVVLLCFVPLMPAFADPGQAKIKLAEKILIARSSLIFCAALALLILFERPYLEPLYVTRQAPEIRAQVEPLTTKLRAEIGTARLWTLFPAVDANGFLSHLLKYHLSPGATKIEEDAAVLTGDQQALKAELRNWEYMWFPVQNPELDAALERLIGTQVEQRVYRIEVSGDAISFTPMPGIF